MIEPLHVLVRIVYYDKPSIIQRSDLYTAGQCISELKKVVIDLVAEE